MQERHFLNSWKEVADYVGRSERTLQRWEKNWKLPVHRPAGRMRSAVIALTTEIDDWIRQAPVAGTEKAGAILQPLTRAEKERLPPPTNQRLPMLLCVDDDVDSGNLRKQFLEANGYCVLMASDGDRGVELFENNRIALVVLNGCEESLDGEVVARMFKRRKPKVPIVIMRGVQELSAGMRRLADSVVANASGSDALLSTIRAWA